MAAHDAQPRRSGTATSSTHGDGEPDLLYIDLHLVHEVTSARRPSTACAWPAARVRRPDLTVATEDHNVPTDGHRPADRRPDLGASRSRCCARNCAEFGIRLLPDGRPRPGHRARHRARAGPHAAGHDDRVRRQPHVDPRRVRRAGLRHRHQRGRARARHPDAAAGAGRARWPSPSTATLPAGVTAKDVILAIIGRIGTGGGIGSRHRVPRLGDPRAVDGRPHDGLQHVDRGRRPGRADRARRHDVRLPRGPAARAEGRRRGSAALDDWRTLVTDDGADVRQGGRARRRRRSRPHVTWGTNPAQVVADRRRRARPRRRSPTPSDARRRRPGARVHGPHRRHADARHRASTPCSSARAPTAASRTCAPRPRWPRAARSTAGVRTLVVPGSLRGEGAGRGRGPRPACSAPPASTGASRAARCAWP